MDGFNMPQNLIPFFLLIGAFLTFLQYVERIYKEALDGIKRQGCEFKFKLTDDPTPEVERAEANIKKLYDKVTNPQNLRLSWILGHISMGMTAALLLALSFLAFLHSCYFGLLVYSTATSDSLLPYLFDVSIFLTIVFPLMCIVAASMRFQVRSLRKDLKNMEQLLNVYKAGSLKKH